VTIGFWPARHGLDGISFNVQPRRDRLRDGRERFANPRCCAAISGQLQPSQGDILLNWQSLYAMSSTQALRELHPAGRRLDDHLTIAET